MSLTGKRGDLDCVLIGPHELDFDQYEAGLRAMGEDSIAYRVLKTNSTVLDGRRMTYFDMLNRLMTDATGRKSDLHVCKLPSLAIGHLKTALHRAGLIAEEVNFFTWEQDRLVELLAQNPLAVAITSTFYVDNDALTEIVAFVRKHNPSTRIIVGGPHILNVYNNYDAKAQDFIFRTIGADIYICDSQGEGTLTHLLRALRNRRWADVALVPNLVFSRDASTFERTGRSIEDNPIADSIVDWSLFAPDFYAPTVQMRTARSCAYSCAFCQYPQLGGPLSLNSIEHVEHQLRTFKEAGVENVVFIDDTFNVPFPRFKKLCRMMIENEFDFNWFSFFRCANSDDEAFDLMAESGCKGVFLGIESGDDRILKNMNKSASSEKYRRGIGKLNERGILSFASLIVGFPGETQESIKNTMDFIAETSPTFYRAEMYYHYSAVPIHQQADQYGLKGTGYHWRHDTMDAEQACAAVETMYRNIDNSLIMPGYMFDFWSIPYLFGQGLQTEHLTSFMRTAGREMVRHF
ncbi:PhpK family radical SAM P-methyltransferase [Streptomyces sp. NPDC008163]|uniref:PhpK family radical SAM P-methyltransferase n=1 Tax=Streptomyces sp. NPDC008163 TaxID=3364818 RepID=UPI0036EB4B58